MGGVLKFLTMLLFKLVGSEADPSEATREPQEQNIVPAILSSVGILDVVVFGALGYIGYHYLMKKKDDYVDVSSQFTIQSQGIGGNTMNKGFISKMTNSKRRMVSFYGSQTGTAEEYASRLAKEGQMYGMRGIIADPEECDMEDLSKLKQVEEVLGGGCLAVFCLATHGEGDPTDNAQEFFDWLQSDAVDLSGMKYAVFGLGNKTYEHYNSMGIYVDKRLEELGATRIHALGLGDDDANLEDDFITWKEAFWTSVCQEFDLKLLGDDFCMRQYKEKVLTEGDFDPDKVYTGEITRLKSYTTQRPPFDPKNPFMAPIKVNRNLHKPASDRYCMHIELDITGSNIRYDSGDHVAVYPMNDAGLVDSIGKLLGVNLDTVFTMKATDEDATKKNPFPCPTTYRTALTYYVDITAIPRTHVLKGLSEYAADESEKEKLLLMTGTTQEGKDLYAKWVVESCRHITHILEDLPSCRPPIDHVMELLPRLQARFYSISSSSRLHRDSIHVTAVLVDYQTPTGRNNKGVATSWLKSKVPAEGEVCKVPIYVRRSQFRLPNRPQTPVIMVGPGTGLAPFRGFIQERAWQKRVGKEVGPTILFFGCRNRDKDYIYQEELESFVEEGVLTLHTAFSRDQAQKVYVSHLLRQQSAELWRLLDEENAHFYICGDAKLMAKDVNQILLEIVMKHGVKSVTEAESYIKAMEKQKRISSDVWS